MVSTVNEATGIEATDWGTKKHRIVSHGRNQQNPKLSISIPTSATVFITSWIQGTLQHN
jgi:hypothetical protein